MPPSGPAAIERGSRYHGKSWESLSTSCLTRRTDQAAWFAINAPNRILMICIKVRWKYIQDANPGFVHAQSTTGCLVSGTTSALSGLSMRGSKGGKRGLPWVLGKIGVQCLTLDSLDPTSFLLTILVQYEHHQNSRLAGRLATQQTSAEMQREEPAHESTERFNMVRRRSCHH